MSKVRVCAAALAAIPFAALTLMPAGLEAASEHEVTVVIKTVKATDKADVYSKGDFYAQVTIDGDKQKSAFIRQDAEVSPNWTFRKMVKPGTVDVKVEVFDKDVSKDDLIDINRVDAKRDLDFTVNTKKCRIEGFAQTYKCGRTITRGGKEDKRADVSFEVTVKK